MRHYLAALTVLVSLAGITRLAHAQEDKVKLCVLALNLSIDKTRKDSDACKGAIMTQLKDARDKLSSKAANAETLTTVKRAVEDLVDGPASACGDAVKKELERAMSRLTEAVDEHAPKSAPAAAAPSGPSPSAAALEQAKLCWNFVNAWTRVDPGCGQTRDGKPHLDRLGMEKLAGKVRMAEDRFAKATVLENAFGDGKTYVTSLQLSSLLALLGEEVDRLETVKRAAKKIVDPHNASTFARHFQDGMMRQDALQTVSEFAPQN